MKSQFGAEKPRREFSITTFFSDCQVFRQIFAPFFQVKFGLLKKETNRFVFF